MRKSLFFGVVLLIALASFSSGAEETEVRQLTLEESVAMGLENNLDLKQTAHNLSLREIEYQEAEINNLLRTSIVTLRNAELNLKKARHADTLKF